MDLFPTDEQALLASTARNFVTRATDPQSVRALEASEPGYDLGHWTMMVDLGWTDLAPLELVLVADQLGQGALPSPLIITGALRNALPTLAADHPADAVITLAANTPGAVHEYARPYPSIASALTASYLLVPYAMNADVVVAATSDGLVTLDSRATGCVQTREPVVGGDAMFRLDCTGAPTTAIAGDVYLALDHLAITALAYATGAAEAALGLSVQHARDRHQFGRPVGAFQAVAHRCADMRAEVDACRVLAQRAAWALARGSSATYEVTAALGYAKDALRRVAMHAHQVHGAIGFSTEHDLHLFTRRIKAFELSYGSTAWHQERFAQALGLQA